MKELEGLLLSRNYSPQVIHSATTRALTLSRTECLKKVTKKRLKRPVFATTFHPALPSMSNILTKAWKVMVKDTEMKEVFPLPPLTAYRQPKNSSLKSLLVKTKLPEQRRPSRQTAGMKRCNRAKCNACPFITTTNKVKSAGTNFSINLGKEYSCTTSNVIYCISCDKAACKGMQYIGETGRQFEKRFNEHIGYVRTCDLTQPTGAHFNLPGHSLSNMKAVILDKCRVNSSTSRKLRESYLINKFGVRIHGMNKRR